MPLGISDDRFLSPAFAVDAIKVAGACGVPLSDIQHIATAPSRPRCWWCPGNFVVASRLLLLMGHWSVFSLWAAPRPLHLSAVVVIIWAMYLISWGVFVWLCRRVPFSTQVLPFVAGTLPLRCQSSAVLILG
jgi:hypothetical protein